MRYQPFTRAPWRAALVVLTLLFAAQAVTARNVDQSSTLTRSVLSSAAAARALSVAEAAARQQHVGVSISIIDEHGALLREVRMDGASTTLIDYARRKAQTALLFGSSTSTLAADPGMARLIGQFPNLLLVPGGVEIRFDDQVIGAIGVSGAAPDVDAAIAIAALQALQKPETK